MNRITWEEYHLKMNAIRDAARVYADLSDGAGPGHNLAWHQLLEAALDYADARRALVDGINTGAVPPDPHDT